MQQLSPKRHPGIVELTTYKTNKLHKISPLSFGFGGWKRGSSQISRIMSKHSKHFPSHHCPQRGPAVKAASPKYQFFGTRHCLKLCFLGHSWTSAQGSRHIPSISTQQHTRIFSSEGEVLPACAAHVLWPRLFGNVRLRAAEAHKWNNDPHTPG